MQIVVFWTEMPSISAEVLGFAYRPILAGLLFRLPFDLEDGGSTFLRNVSERLPNYMAPHPRRQYLIPILTEDTR
jgi:hypothetical protein